MNVLYKLSLSVAVTICLAACKKVGDPAATTKEVSDVTANSAVVSGIASGDKLLERGVCWAVNNSLPTIKDTKVPQGAEEGAYNVSLNNLSPNTRYYYRAYCASRLSISYGETREFTTILQPSVAVFDLSPNSETSFSVAIHFDPKNTSVIESGICISTSSAPTISDTKVSGSQVGSFLSMVVDGLNANTVYFVRPYMIIKGGNIFYGPERKTRTFTGVMTDIDGNLYYTITIGTQVWMASNLRVTKFRNGDALEFSPLNNWYNVTTPKYGYYNESSANLKEYGVLYDRKCITDARKIAPTGWRVPTKSDWEQLSIVLGLNVTSHASVRAASFKKGTNESGFSIFGAGYRVYSGDYNRDVWAGHWLSDELLIGSDLEQGYWQFSSSNSDNLFLMGIDWLKYDIGMSLRCIKE